MKGYISEESASKCLSTMVIILSYLIAISCTTMAMGTSRTNPSFSLEDNELLEAQQPPPEVLLTPPQSSSFHVINECVKITMDEGVFHFKSRGGEQVCGLYFVADPDKVVVISVDYIDVRCSDKGLVSVVDGWELNGEVFPSIDDHEKPPQERFHDLCIDPNQRHEMRRTFTSTQNAALIQYRVPGYGQGFSIRVRHVENPRPCNILVQDLEAVYKLENFGKRLNCSLTTLFDAKIRVIHMSTGLQGSSHVKYPHTPSRIHTSGVYHKCEKMGLEDYVQIGGSSGLDTSKMQPIEEFCGYQSHPMNKYTTVFCGMTTLRLVSSGKFQNKIVAEVRRADIEDLDSANFICDI